VGAPGGGGAFAERLVRGGGGAGAADPPSPSHPYCKYAGMDGGGGHSYIIFDSLPDDQLTQIISYSTNYSQLSSHHCTIWGRVGGGTGT
jgi:hypothetical protein